MLDHTARPSERPLSPSDSRCFPRVCRRWQAGQAAAGRPRVRAFSSGGAGERGSGAVALHHAQLCRLPCGWRRSTVRQIGADSRWRRRSRQSAATSSNSWPIRKRSSRAPRCRTSLSAWTRTKRKRKSKPLSTISPRPVHAAPARPDARASASARISTARSAASLATAPVTPRASRTRRSPPSVPLGDLKAKYNLTSLKAFLENPLQTRPHGRMPGILNAKEASEVANYLLQGATPGLTANNMKYAITRAHGKPSPISTKIKPVKSGEASDFDLARRTPAQRLCLEVRGTVVKIETEGSYTFHVTSDDGSKLWIDDKQIVNNDGIHRRRYEIGQDKARQRRTQSCCRRLQRGGGFELHVEIEGPGLGKQPLGPRIVSHRGTRETGARGSRRCARTSRWSRRSSPRARICSHRWAVPTAINGGEKKRLNAARRGESQSRRQAASPRRRRRAFPGTA